MPDNGLANLAGALIAAGHEALILDYGTVDTIRRLYPERLSTRAASFCNRVFNDSDPGYSPTYRDMLFLKYLDWRLARHQEKEVHTIAVEICQKIREYRPDFIGFKLWTGDGFLGSARIAELIRRTFPSLPIYAGGPHVDIFRGSILESRGIFDALNYGDGEETIVKLADRSKGGGSLRGIPNLICRDNGTSVVNEPQWIRMLDQLPFPVYQSDVYLSMADNQKMKIITIDETRGCFCNCYFCAHPNKSGKRLRMKTPERFVAELKWLTEQYSFTVFRYAGSATPSLFARKVAERIMRDQLEIQYSMFGNILISRSEDLDALKKSGCQAIFFGVESGSERILAESFGKRFSIPQAKKILRDCKASGIFTIASIIYPAPFEDTISRNETVDFLKELKPDSVVMTFPILIPTTAWAEDPGRFGFRINDRNFIEHAMDYKIKWLLPPRFWKRLPYTLNGKKFNYYTRMTSNLSRDLREEGLSVGISDDLVLMARLAGYRGKESHFLNEAIKIFFSGDWGKAQDLTVRINAAVKKRIPSYAHA